ncbi:MAG: hypothetical protein NTW29_20405 [Bacteroidetes bacterium]|nr:hypothetical protein [Bacteroidota bacterium]
MKKNLFAIVSILLAGFVLVSCKKENDAPEEPQGVNFNQLLKTVTTSNYTNQKITTEYGYNASGKVISITTTGSTNGGVGNFTNTEIITRNAQGLPETIEFTSISASGTTRISTRNKFDGTGKTIGTIQVITGPQQTRDSALYVYSGNQLVQRPEYRSINNGPYSLLVTSQFQYTGSGSLDKAIFAWTTHPGIDTLSFNYDDKVNSLPFTRADAFYFAELFYDDYKSANNITRYNNPSISSYTSEFRYSANNKPLYRKKSFPGTANFDETLYYYD